LARGARLPPWRVALYVGAQLVASRRERTRELIDSVLAREMVSSRSLRKVGAGFSCQFLEIDLDWRNARIEHLASQLLEALKQLALRGGRVPLREPASHRVERRELEPGQSRSYEQLRQRSTRHRIVHSVLGVDVRWDR
jgi:hypothetical protein